MKSLTNGVVALATILSASILTSAHAQVVDPYYDDVYTVVNLGSVPGVPGSYGGLTFKYDDPNTLLIGGSANNVNAAIYAIQVQRSCNGSITGFVGTATVFASAPQIDGGLAYGPGNVLFYTTYSNNTIGQIKPGDNAPSKIINLSQLGMSASTGSLAFVPAGFAGAGQLKILIYSTSQWYSADVVPDGAGTYDIVNVAFHATIGGGPEGVVYIDDVNPLFDVDSILVTEYGLGRVSSYELNSNGDPNIKTRRTFLSGLSGAEGAVIDPVSGHFLFSTFGGGDRIVAVNGFVDSCPADVAPGLGDNVVNVADLLAVISSWGQSCVGPDINGSGTVNVADLLIVISQWGPCN